MHVCAYIRNSKTATPSGFHTSVALISNLIFLLVTSFLLHNQYLLQLLIALFLKLATVTSSITRDKESILYNIHVLKTLIPLATPALPNTEATYTAITLIHDLFNTHTSYSYSKL